MPTLGNQNIANLNVNVTSNVTGVTAQLSSLQKALNSLKSQSSFSIPGLSQATTQLTGLTNSVRSLTSSVSGLGQGTANVSNQFINMNRSGSGITNMLLGWGILTRTFKTDWGYFSTAVGLSALSMKDFSTAMISTGRSIEDGIKRGGSALGAFFTSYKAMTSSIKNNNLKIFDNGSFRDITFLDKIKQGSNAIWNRIQDSGEMFGNAFKSMKQGASNLLDSLKSLGQGTGYLFNSLKAFGPMIATTFITGIVAIGTALTALTAKFIKAGFEYNSMMEQMKTGYDVMLQGANNAKGYGEVQSSILMSQLKNFANVTPFTMPQVAKGADLLLGYGVGEGSKDQVTKVMAAVQMLGDVSRGIPEKFNDIAYAFGQVTAMGRLQGQELRQMINAGWNPLMEMVTKDRNMEQLKTDMEDGKISIDDVTRALIKATSEGGRFYKMMEKQSQTGIGKWSTITDKASMLVGNATLALFEKMKPLLDDIINILDMFLENVNQIGASIVNNLLPPLQSTFKQILNILGITDSVGGTLTGVANATDIWTAALGSALKVFNVIFNLSVLFVSTFVAGLSSLAAGFLTVGAVGAEIILGLGRLITACIIRPLQAIGMMDKGPNSVGDRILNSMDQDIYGVAEYYFKGMKTLTDMSNAATIAATGAAKNLLGDVEGVESLLKREKQVVKNNWKSVDVNSLLGAIGSTKAGKDALDKMNDSANKLAESIKGIADRFVSMGNVFEKVSYEKFSPYKLQVRMGRFLQEIQSWSKNLATLSAQGVPQGMIQELRGMGMQGYGMTKAMVNSSDAQRKSLIDNYQKAKGIGYNEADKKAKFDNMINNITITGNSVVSPELVDILATKVVEKIRKLGG